VKNLRALPRIDLSTPVKRRQATTVLDALIEQRDQLRKMAERYPLFIMVADRQHVSESPDDVDALIVGVELGLAEHRGLKSMILRAAGRLLCWLGMHRWRNPGLWDCARCFRCGLHDTY